MALPVRASPAWPWALCRPAPEPLDVPGHRGASAALAWSEATLSVRFHLLPQREGR